MTSRLHAQGYFTLIDDDASNVASICAVNDIAEKMEIKVCYAVIASHIQEKTDVLDKLLKYQNNGHQIINHSLTHSKGVWCSCNRDLILKEIIESRSILDSMRFKNSEYLVYPYGKFSQHQFDVIKPLVENHYKLAFNSRGRYNEIGKDNKYYLQRLPLRKYNDMYMVKHVIDKAVENNGWLVFLTHSGMKRDFDPGYVSEVIQYCKQKGMKNCTVEDFYQLNYKSLKANSVIDEIGKVHDLKDLVYMNFIKLSVGFLLLSFVIFSFLLWKKRFG